MSKLSICIPTYGRQSVLEDLCAKLLLPIHKRYGKVIDIYVRDNSIGLEGYNFSLIEELFTFADYRLNPSNLSYHGNVLTLYNLCEDGSYIWFLPDDDAYNINTVCDIIDAILSGLLIADVILPPFSYTKNPDFISTKSISQTFSTNSLYESHISNTHATTFDELLSRNTYPFIPLTSSFIFRKKSTPHGAQVIKKNATNAWLHEILMLATVDRFSTIQIVVGAPYVYYQEIYDSRNKPLKSGMSIEYFHENNIKLKLLRSVIFKDKTLFDLLACWRESVLWLIQDKDGSIAWTNNTLYSFKLAIKATLFSIRSLDLWLLTLCICYLFLPSWLIRFIRRFRCSNRTR